MARCVEAEEVGVERAAAVRLGGRRRSVEEHGAHGARHVGFVVDSAPVGVGISVAAQASTSSTSRLPSSSHDASGRPGTGRRSTTQRISLTC
jgi:hypothetical protein